MYHLTHGICDFIDLQWIDKQCSICRDLWQ